MDRITTELTKLIPGIEILDPLGEIRATARQFWTEDGKPEHADWSAYWHRAEQLLVGPGRHSRPERRVEEPRAQIEPPAPLVLETDYELSKLIGKGFNKRLLLHEAYCLAWILLNSRLEFPGGKPPVQCSIPEAAEVLADLALEIGSSEESRRAAGEISREARLEEWKRLLTEYVRADEPLAFNDRNTILRLRKSLLDSSAVAGIEVVDPKPQT